VGCELTSIVVLVDVGIAVLGSVGNPGVTVVVVYMVETKLEGTRKNLLESIMLSRLSCCVQEIKLLLHGMYTYV